MSSSPRQPGLDTLRALAIVLVFANHYMGFVTDEPTFGFVSEMGWAGVDLFFALSGYLIGNQIVAALREGRFAPGRFAARRLLRTVPNYYVVLALYAFWPPFAAGTWHKPWWEYLTFTLNFGLMPGTRFSHAWSLCVEEQFYFALPIVAMLVARLPRARTFAWVLLGAGLVVGLWCRERGWQAAGMPDGVVPFYRDVYYATLCRFDELLAGVALAVLRQCHAPLWARLTSYGNVTLTAGLLVTTAAFLGFLDDHFGHWQTLFGYPLLALGFGLLVLAALSPNSLLARVRLPGAGSLAVWSYAFYLTHKGVCIALARELRAEGIDPATPAGIAILVAASLLAGWLLYAVVETPFMKLRERFVPAHPRSTPPSMAAAA